MTIPSIFTVSFWFAVFPPPFLTWVDRTLLMLSVLACISGVVLIYLTRRLHAQKKLEQQVWNLTQMTLLWSGVIGLLLYTFTYERIPYLSMRVWWLALVAWTLWRCLTIWRLVYIKLPHARKEAAQREQYTKWLPKKRA